MLMGKVAQAFLDQPATKYTTGSKEIDDKHLPQEIADKLLQKTLVFQLRFGSRKHSYARNDLPVASVADPDKAAQLLRLKALAEPTTFAGQCSSSTSTDLPLSIDLHIPELPHKRSIPDTHTPLPPTVPSNTKRRLLFRSDDKPHDNCRSITSLTKQHILYHYFQLPTFLYIDKLFVYMLQHRRNNSHIHVSSV